ncbi:MAG: CrcB family protein [Actinomycetota bacterium]|nr:CrcB family protein [Actinomycetota bacterium]
MSAETPRSSADAPVLAVIAFGGGIGSVLRYALSRSLNPPGGGFPTGTLIINIVGSALLGALVVAVSEVWRPHRLVCPLLGTGVLGGFTTFSTFALESRGLAGPAALGYVAASLSGGLVTAFGAMGLTRGWAARRGAPGAHGAVDPVDPELP